MTMGVKVVIFSGEGTMNLYSATVVPGFSFREQENTHADAQI